MSGYCTNFDVLWKTDSTMKPRRREDEGFKGIDRYRRQACFADVRGYFCEMEELVLYVLKEYEGENQYGDDYADSSSCEFTFEEMVTYTKLLNKMGMLCEFIGEGFCEKSPCSPEAYVFRVFTSQMPEFASFMTVTALRYLYENCDGHTAIARAFLDFSKDRTALTSTWNKFVVAHYILKSCHSGHSIRPYLQLIDFQSDKKCREWLQERNRGKAIDSNLPNGGELARNSRTSRSEPVDSLVAAYEKGTPFRELLRTYREYLND